MTGGAELSAAPFELEERAGAANGPRVVRGVVETLGPLEEGDGGGGAGRPFALLLHGFRSFMGWGFLPELSRRLAARGFAAVRFEMSGNGIGPDGESFCEPELFARNTYSREIEDTERVRAHVAALPGVDPRRGVLVGHSRGAGVALIHAAERGDYRALCGWATIVEVASWTPEKKRRWRASGTHLVPAPVTGEPVGLHLDVLDDAERNAERFDLRAVAAATRTPTLLVHGSRDSGIPLAAIRSLHEAFPPGTAQLAVVEGAGHVFGSRHPLREVGPLLEEALGRTLDFLVPRVQPPAPP